MSPVTYGPSDINNPRGYPFVGPVPESFWLTKALLFDFDWVVREAQNPNDANAVRVDWRGRKLGYVPRRENAALAWGMDRGTPLRARVSRLVEHPNPARRIEFEVYLE